MSKWILAMLLILGFGFPVNAGANGLPTFAMQNNPNGTISPLKKVPVAVKKEVLTIELSGNNPALIKANYTLKNLSANKISTTVLFPVDAGQNAAVVFNGRRLALKRTSFIRDLSPGDFEVSNTWIDPYNNHRYRPHIPNNSSDALYTPLRLELIVFQVALEPNKEGSLTVTYAQAPSYDANWLFNDINYRFDYLLQPARHWAGFSNLEINVLTKGSMSLASTIRLQKVSPNHYQARFDKLPQENLSLFVGIKPNKLRASAAAYLFNGPFGFKVFTIISALCILFFLIRFRKMWFGKTGA